MARNVPPTNAEALQLIQEKSWQTDLASLMRLTRFIVGTADSVVRFTGATNRDTVYAWTAKRSFPEPEQERLLRTLACLATFTHEECGAAPIETRNYLHSFNYSQSGVERTRLERLAAGETTEVFEETVQYFGELGLE